MITASDGYKTCSDVATLTIKPSSAYQLQLAIQYLGIIGSITGFIVYYPKIMNIIFRKRYSHPLYKIYKNAENEVPVVAYVGPYKDGMRKIMNYLAHKLYDC